MATLVVAEKPSVARTIRYAVRPPRVLALRGHFLELDFPSEYSKWRSVDPERLFSAPVIRGLPGTGARTRSWLRLLKAQERLS
jgi:DNA topoisomerase IA